MASQKCNNAQNDIGLTIEEKQWLSNNNTIKLAFDPELPPLIFLNEDNEIEGITGDNLNLIAKKLNVNLNGLAIKHLKRALKPSKTKMLMSCLF